MTFSGSPARIARDIIGTNRYMVLATADREGVPWGSPVYFAHRDYREFFWISSPQATHSRNLAVRPQVGLVVFDSSVPIGTGQGVYMSAVATAVDGSATERAIEVYSRRSLTHGGRMWTGHDVQGASDMRLYRAVAQDHSILAKDGRPDHRIPVDLT
ncbi:pyridoxamine 5'-phosphate oxidase family protein [Streptomyces sp. NL15-2K]|uniref:pyridoxamine 5'-phosphate oxidase family protein n=1 Tax=Streptomyces sp. NL15-2K TaxID=376149 RepID=UPI000F575D9D|nr:MULTISPECIES: pyridoxamine 5'-phosphate oxidase family protein [Actinomycetes]WKX06361.1 pyridoxamine 5'-phosphate oxidase family protein [Kutzneria buriramensis]GCB43356.1 pyridoxamine 5'-phosphate oxidase-related [Streptomyces sp. NL15-2K]